MSEFLAISVNIFIFSVAFHPSGHPSGGALPFALPSKLFWFQVLLAFPVSRSPITRFVVVKCNLSCEVVFVNWIFKKPCSVLLSHLASAGCALLSPICLAWPLPPVRWAPSGFGRFPPPWLFQAPSHQIAM